MKTDARTFFRVRNPEKNVLRGVISNSLIWVNGKPPLKYFDGATMQSYKIPRRAYETIYCRRPDPAEECQYLLGYDPLDTECRRCRF